MNGKGSAAAYIDAVTAFIFTEDAPAPADVLFVPGSSSPLNAVRAAELYHAGYAPLIIPSGKHSILAESFSRPFATEADFLTDILLQHGVPESAIRKEPEATYTWENAQLSRRLTDAAGLTVRRAILCCKAYHARRAALYYQAAFPETQLLVCPARTPSRDRDDWWLTEAGRRTVLGEVNRLSDQTGEVFRMMLGQNAEVPHDDT